LLSGFAPLIDNITTGGGGGGLQIISGQVPSEGLTAHEDFTITGLPGNPVMVYIFHTLSGEFDVTDLPAGILFYVRVEETTVGSNLMDACPYYGMFDALLMSWEYENGSLILGAHDASSFWSLWYVECPVYYVMVV